MGLNFRKSIKIAPGVKLNLGKKSASVSVGTKGARFTTSTTGRKTASVGLPGTGLSYTKTVSTNNSSKKTQHNANSKGTQAATNMNSPNYATHANASNNFSVLSLIFGILSWITGCCCCAGPIFSILGLVYSKKGEKENGLNKFNIWGKRLSMIGLVVQIIFLCIFGSTPSDDATQSTETMTTTEITTEVTTELTTELTTEITTELTTEEITEATTEPTTEVTTEVTTETTTATTEATEETVWIPSSGSKYHSYSSCSGMKSPTEVTKSKAESMGYTPCKRCH